MSKITVQKIKNILPTLLILGILIPATGCQAASDLFHPDTYKMTDAEPWEKNVQRKPVKTKKPGDQL